MDHFFQASRRRHRQLQQSWRPRPVWIVPVEEYKRKSRPEQQHSRGRECWQQEGEDDKSGQCCHHQRLMLGGNRRMIIHKDVEEEDKGKTIISIVIVGFHPSTTITTRSREQQDGV